MKQSIEKLSIFNFALFICLGLCAGSPLNAYGQAARLTKADFERETDRARAAAEKTYPRRETEVKLIETEVYGESDELVETILNERKTREYQKENVVRYEFKKVNTKGATITNRLLIGAICYEQTEKNWIRIEGNCDMLVVSISSAPSKEEFFVENGFLDAKPVKIFRNVQTERRYSAADPIYFNEYRYYTDSAGRLVKLESLSRKGDEKAELRNFTTYEYDVKIEPVRVPPVGEKRRKRR